MRACNYLRKLLPSSQVHMVDVLHATRGALSKKEVMSHFRSGEILVLCATEVVGMVCTFHSCIQRPHHILFQGTDIPDVDDVVQFMTTEALAVWIQRAGRAGRDGRLSRAILLVEPSVAKKLTPKSSKNPKGTSNGSNDNAPERSGDDDASSDNINAGDGNNGDDDGSNNDDEDSNDDSPDVPTKGWEEFDEDAAYQKKHVDPEMRQWALTNDCWRIISDEFFNNPVDKQGTCNLFLKKGSNCIAYSRPIGLVL